MSCTTESCGTGGWNGPKPGDPDNNIVLSAVPVYSGIEVSWTYPGINPHAVSHVRVFRGDSAAFEMAAQIRIIAGNQFIDEIALTDKTRYYYWIRVVSINGTTSDPVGPASAIAGDYAQHLLNAISGKITYDLLDGDLRNGIDRISLFDRDLGQEILDRISGNAALADALEHVRSDTSEALTYVLQQITETKTSTDAAVEALTVLAAGVGGDSSAAIVTEQNVRAAADAALAEDLKILFAQVTGNTAALSAEQKVLVDQYLASASSLLSLVAKFNENVAAIELANTVRANEDSALSQRIDDMQVQVGDDISALHQELTQLEATMDGTAIAQQINTLSTRVDENEASVQTVTSSINGVLGKHTVTIDVNGHISGYGLMSSNNGGVPSSAFIVNANSFGVGMPGYPNYYPFTVANSGLNFNGNVEGTIAGESAETVKTNAANAVQDAAAAQAAAEAALQVIADMASDGVLTPLEKQQAKREWDAIVAEYGNIMGQSITFSMPGRTNYQTAYNNLNTYLSPLISDLTTSSPIVGATFRSYFTLYYQRKQEILSQISNYASTIAIWDNVWGSGRPENGATNGAQVGVNLKRPDGVATTGLDILASWNKLSDSNIATFMQTAVIGTAYIKDLSVGTLKIANNAVTVPSTNNGIYVAAVNVTLAQPGHLTAIATFVQGNGKAGHVWRLFVAGQQVQAEYPSGGTTGALSGSVYVSQPGTYSCYIACDTQSGDGRCGITVLGTMK